MMAHCFFYTNSCGFTAHLFIFSNFEMINGRKKFDFASLNLIIGCKLENRFSISSGDNSLT